MDESIVTNGSWPNFGWIIKNSPIIADHWYQSNPNHQKLLKDMLGKDIWKDDLSGWADSPMVYFRILGMLIWIDQNSNLP